MLVMQAARQRNEQDVLVVGRRRSSVQNREAAEIWIRCTANDRAAGHMRFACPCCPLQRAIGPRRGRTGTREKRGNSVVLSGRAPHAVSSRRE